MTEQTTKERHKVHVTSPDTACGYVGHMTVDELREVAAGTDFEINCPACGAIHLTREEIEVLEKAKFTDTEAYKETVRQAQASSE